MNKLGLEIFFYDNIVFFWFFKITQKSLKKIKLNLLNFIFVNYDFYHFQSDPT